MQRLGFLVWLCFPFVAFAQESNPLLVKKTYPVQDSITLDTVSINPFGFAVYSTAGDSISTAAYQVDFGKAVFYPDDRLLSQFDSLQISYRHYPSFITQTYQQFDPQQIVHHDYNRKGLYNLAQQDNKPSSDFTPFDGLNTSGSISRGMTAGTNQNAVLDSKLDLQITGKIAPKVNLRASIQDANIPIQQGGYSQNLNEFDQIFIELYSQNWAVRGGDIDLEEQQSYFANYQKKIQGISVKATLNPDGNQTEIFAAGGLVRGVYTRNEIMGQDGNQGPYRLSGPNGELYALVVSGSEKVYVNGIQLKRGEHEDYVIDYNAGEIRFNPTFPITANSRITVEFQYADRNYARIIATGGVQFHSDKWTIGGFIYSENDLRNQPLQQTLNDTQKFILADAGDDPQHMTAPSAISDDFAENKVLYKKDTINGHEVFVYSTNPQDDLYRVKFSLVGPNQGNYKLVNRTSITPIYEYVSPINGIPQGEYAPITQLFAPQKLQLAVINGSYKPSDKTAINFELAGSNRDENLFSDLDDGNNSGFAGHLDLKQRLYTNTAQSQINSFAKIDYIQSDFSSIEPLYNVEFNRDWNIGTSNSVYTQSDSLNAPQDSLAQEIPEGDQLLIDAGVEYLSPQHGFARYHLQHLDFGNTYSGTRHVLNSNLNFGELSTAVNASILHSDGQLYTSTFGRLQAEAIYHYDPLWSGIRYTTENNQQTENTSSTHQLTPFSQRYQSYNLFTGIGDSTKVYAEIGYKHRITDSVRTNQLTRVSYADSYYLKAQALQSETTNLSIYVNYRQVHRVDDEEQNEKSLNSRLLYQQYLFDKLVALNTTYETTSGTLPQQEYTYMEVEPGQGQYTWIDYNNDGVQDLGEFEISPFPDQAKYIRVLLPNRIYIRTRQNSFSQIVTLNFQQLNQGKAKKSWLGHFFNQTSYIVNRKTKREGNAFNLNPFHSSGEELAVNSNFRNSLYFNRGKQHFSSIYTYLNSTSKSLFSTGLQSMSLESHQLEIRHKLGLSWLINWLSSIDHSSSQSESFENRNYRIDGLKLRPEITFILNPNTRFEVYYQYRNRQNQIGQEETLTQQKIGLNFHFAKAAKYSINGSLNYIYNTYDGNPFSPVAYELLEGLQPDQNFTWQVLFQKKITAYLDLNLSYNGRKSQGSSTIHTGSVQLKAYF